MNGTDGPVGPEHVLTVSRATKNFGGLMAVNDVSFALEKGEILGLIGPNGAGKTTMFDLVAGSQKPTSGSIAIHGHEVSGQSAWRRIGHGLGRTFQIPKPFPELSLIDNVMLARQGQAGEGVIANFLTPRKVAAEERRAREKARELIAFVTLSHLEDEPAKVLSGGQRKLLELARVLMADSSIVLLDEPAAGVNATLLEVIIERIREINRGGISFLLIEHNIDMVSRLCGRVLVMASGELLCEGRPDEVARDPRVIEAYLGGAA
ncbi:ABC transporter ATP-binding protein [Martelella mediterranea]|uniref:ABC transporter ATP-binding protein n=1 Tax=Martelella mediterranea TaxID=293089 RepID=UPI001E490ADB|nr:ABC transporter ATP-binding protein [Martelella mediterranea]MCD1633164.1 ABC transporter ATP-binding protein [Martelella mediterranea]